MHPKFNSLVSFLSGIPGLKVLSQDDNGGDDGWWVKLKIDIAQPHAWNIVQELGFVMNELSLTERLPTTFKPVSPPPYLNGGPYDFLAWVIETRHADFPPGTLQKHLKERLPDPAHTLTAWEALQE